MADPYVIQPPPGEVTGTAGDDRLYSGKAADRVDGLGGVDTFVAGGLFTSYQLERQVIGGQVVWQVGGDTLLNVEFIEFGDRLVALDDPVLQQATRHTMTDGADLLVGNDWGYTLNGGVGDDTLIGNGGDDTLYGGKGNDTAVYRGNRADYSVGYDTLTQLYYVRDQVSGRDGNDVLGGGAFNSMETLRFADGEIALAPFFVATPAAPATAPLLLVPSTTSDISSGTAVELLYFLATGIHLDFAVGNTTTSYGLGITSIAVDQVIEAVSLIDELVDIVGLPGHRPWMRIDTYCEP